MTEYSTADASIGMAFLKAYSEHDWDALSKLMHSDVSWELPGHGRISGRAVGREAVLERVRLIVGGGTKTELLHILTGQTAIALSLHNSGLRPDGIALDEYLTTLLRLENGRIRVVETYLSDVAMMERFFEDASPAQ